MAFKKAERTRLWLRLALFGPPGAGKTMSALRIAKGIADRIDGRIAVVDTEARSASKYADRIPFDVDDLGKKDIDTYIQSMEYAVQAGYRVLVIDSLSHAWQELLDEIDRITKASSSKNSWAAWSEGTPKQRRLINAILNFPGHIIVTMRSKIEWELVEEKGKKIPKKLGLAPEQGKGIEYEFDMLVEINQEHFATVTKDRTGKFQDEILNKPDEKFGMALFDWLNAGAAPAPVIKSMEQLIEEYTAAKIELKTILSTSIDDKVIFSQDEYAAVSKTLAALKDKSAEEHIETINLLLAEKKAVLMERMNNLTTPIASSKPPAAEGTASGTQETTKVPAMYNEQEPDERPEDPSGEETAGKDGTDDGFVDDIPWETPSQRPKRNGPRSLSDEFKQRIRDHHAGTGAPAAAGAGGELDIF